MTEKKTKIEIWINKLDFDAACFIDEVTIEAGEVCRTLKIGTKRQYHFHRECIEKFQELICGTGKGKIN